MTAHLKESHSEKILPEAQEQQIIKAYQNGETCAEIGKVHEIHRNSIFRILAQNEVAIRPDEVSTKPAKVERKIELASFPSIVEMYKGGESSSQIAKKFKVTNTIILRILEKQGCDRRNADDTHRKYAIREDYFDSIDTPEKAYLLGFIYADGCNHLEENYIDFNLNVKDINLLYKISKLIYLENSDDRIRFCDRVREHDGKKKIFKHCILSFNSKYMCQVLNKLGCEPRKSLTAKFPAWLIDKELIRHFIRDYYDGDGGTFISPRDKKNVMSRIIGTTQFIHKINLILLKEFNINTYTEIISDSLVRNCISGRRQVKTFLDWIYRDSTIHLDRKYAIYGTLCKDLLEYDSR